MIIDGTLTLESHDDGDVTLRSIEQEFIRSLIKSIFLRHGYESELLKKIIQNPNFYHRLERPNHIFASYATFEQALESFFTN